MKGRLLVKAISRDGQTAIRESYYTPPFKLANVSGKGDAKAMSLMIMSSSPGVLDDDDLSMSIHLGEGAAVNLATQSFQRLFQMKRGAKQKMEITLERNSSLRYLPAPCVPHEQAIFTAENIIHLKPGSRLIYGEVITCGRMLNGEKFKFTRVENRTRVFYDEKLVLKEVVRMTPAVSSHLALGLLEGHTHQASFVCISIADLNDLQQRAIQLLSQHSGVEFGVSAIAANGMIVKLLGSSAYRLHGLLEALADLAEQI